MIEQKRDNYGKNLKNTTCLIWHCMRGTRAYSEVSAFFYYTFFFSYSSLSPSSAPFLLYSFFFFYYPSFSLDASSFLSFLLPLSSTSFAFFPHLLLLHILFGHPSDSHISLRHGRTASSLGPRQGRYPGLCCVDAQCHRPRYRTNFHPWTIWFLLYFRYTCLSFASLGSSTNVKRSLFLFSTLRFIYKIIHSQFWGSVLAVTFAVCEESRSTCVSRNETFITLHLFTRLSFSSYTFSSASFASCCSILLPCYILFPVSVFNLLAYGIGRLQQRWIPIGRKEEWQSNT